MAAGLDNQDSASGKMEEFKGSFGSLHPSLKTGNNRGHVIKKITLVITVSNHIDDGER